MNRGVRQEGDDLTEFVEAFDDHEQMLLTLHLQGPFPHMDY
jgi:hypothetical protein